MNVFSSTILLNNQAVQYQIFPFGKKFKAVLMESKLVNCLPSQITFWKEQGEWKTYHSITEQVILQFGSSIDNYLMTAGAGLLKDSAVA
jgi:hypothetical protein